ncbi:MAG: 2Fe-2S iron-sulfur cluster-binding protein [Cyanobacteria bacterium P01_H01_bin.58]
MARLSPSPTLLGQDGGSLGQVLSIGMVRGVLTSKAKSINLKETPPMADVLDRFQNPLARGCAAALIGASAASIVSGGLLGLTLLEDRWVHRISTYAALAGAGVGAVLGIAAIRPVQRKSARTEIEAPPATDEWKSWRNFEVVRKVEESREITSFYLKPQESMDLPSFQPGQFLTIKLNIPEQSRPVIRTYSLSDYQAQPDYYRLSIKREGPPKGQEVPPGVASSFMHDQIQVGSVIPAKPPTGKFVLDVHGDRPAVLISNGVGITPMISMAKAAIAANPNRPIWFLHGARDGSFHACREEVLAIAPDNSNFRVHYRYSRPRMEDDGGYHSTGYVDIDLIKALVAPVLEEQNQVSAAEYFLCGSPAFMDSLRNGLADWGVPDSQVYFESFAKPAPKAKAATEIAAIAATGTTEVVFTQSGKTTTWTPTDGTLLEFAEDQGLSPDFSCRAGICLTCMCRLEEGEVAYDEPPSGTPDEGSVLICVAKPRTDKVVLDI